MMLKRLQVTSTTDAALLRAFFRKDPVASALLLGDLDEPYRQWCRWFVATYRERPVGVVAVYEGLSTPALLSYGAPDGVAAVLRECAAELPAECDAKIPPEHREAFAESYRIVGCDPQWVMGLDPADFDRETETGGVRPLDHSDLPAMLELYEAYPGNFFEPGQLDSGLYFGRSVDGKLVAISGTLVASEREEIAMLGNLVTAPEARGRGHARASTSRLIEALHERGCRTVALHVAATNAPAISCYRRLGFSFGGVVLQAVCVRSESSSVTGADTSM